MAQEPDGSRHQPGETTPLKHWPARDVAKTLGVTMGHVYVAKHRISKLIRQEIEILEAKGV